MEFSDDCLTLKLRRLERAEEAEFKRGGFLFVILKSGEGACHCGRLHRHLASGDVLVADSAAGGKIHPRGDGELVLWFFTAECEQLFPLFSGREICLLRKVAEGFKAGRVYPAASPLAKECLRLAAEVPVQLSLEHRTQVLRIVSAILTAEFKAAQPKQSGLLPAQSHAIQVLEGLQTNELLNLSVGELAKKFHCSRRHLNRLFRKHWGLPVAALRMEMRLLKAASLLADPHAKIYGVAAQCGFNHMGPFNSCFKKRFGASPSRWRRGSANGKNPDAALDATSGLGRVSCPMLTNGMCPWHKADLEHFAIVPGRIPKWKG
jgi:AraC-like DNA-binding protein